MIAKIYEDNIWDKQRVIEAYLDICDKNGNLPIIQKKDYPSWEIRKKRLKAVFLSQNIKYETLTTPFSVSKLNYELTETDEDMFETLVDDCGGYLHLISYSISDELFDELKTVLQDYMPIVNYLKLDLRSYPIRCAIFNELFEYRMSVKELINFGSGYLCCPPTTSFANRVIGNVNNSYFQTGADYVDKILKLLMGDIFVQPITVDELIQNYGYPNVTDDELQDIDIENF